MLFVSLYIYTQEAIPTLSMNVSEKCRQQVNFGLCTAFAHDRITVCVRVRFTAISPLKLLTVYTMVYILRVTVSHVFFFFLSNKKRLSTALSHVTFA